MAWVKDRFYFVLLWRIPNSHFYKDPSLYRLSPPIFEFCPTSSSFLFSWLISLPLCFPEGCHTSGIFHLKPFYVAITLAISNYLIKSVISKIYHLSKIRPFALLLQYCIHLISHMFWGCFPNPLRNWFLYGCNINLIWVKIWALSFSFDIFYSHVTNVGNVTILFSFVVVVVVVVVSQMFFKVGVLKHFAIFTGNTSVGVSF